MSTVLKTFGTFWRILLNAFRTPLRVEQVLGDYAYLLAVDATLVVIGVLAFQARDFKS